MYLEATKALGAQSEPHQLNWPKSDILAHFDLASIETSPFLRGLFSEMNIIDL